MSDRLSRLCQADKFHITQTVVMVMMMTTTAFVLKSTLIMMLTRILIFGDEDFLREGVQKNGFFGTLSQTMSRWGSKVPNSLVKTTIQSFLLQTSRNVLKHVIHKWGGHIWPCDKVRPDGQEEDRCIYKLAFPLI